MVEPVIDLPQWDGYARHFGELWRLIKGSRVAVCALFTNPLGAEVRLDVDWEMVRTQAGRDGMALVDEAIHWKQQFIEKGWVASEITCPRCKGSGWVCESHRFLPMNHPDPSCIGAGTPCGEPGCPYRTHETDEEIGEDV
jgi:hypothetical protein